MLFSLGCATAGPGDEPVGIEAPDSDNDAVQQGVPRDTAPFPMPMPELDRTRELTDEQDTEPPVSSDAAAPEQIER